MKSAWKKLKLKVNPAWLKVRKVSVTRLQVELQAPTFMVVVEGVEQVAVLVVVTQAAAAAAAGEKVVRYCPRSTSGWVRCVLRQARRSFIYTGSRTPTSLRPRCRRHFARLANRRSCSACCLASLRRLISGVLWYLKNFLCIRLSAALLWCPCGRNGRIFCPFVLSKEIYDVKTN